MGIFGNFEWYNHERPHSSLKRKTPHQAYNEGLPTLKLAA
ncbi:integrase core domain-containing protein [Methylomonas sp. BW4-1]